MSTQEDVLAHLSVRRCGHQLLPGQPIGGRSQQSGAMDRPSLGSMQRENTEAMAANISLEAGELRAALADCRGDRVAEPKITAALLAHLLVSTRELLQNLLIDTVRRPRLLMAVADPDGDPPGRGA